jgi:FkbM family methyltransferase
MKKKVFIEVGANTGGDTQRFIQPDSIVYCFEPVGELAFGLWEKYKHEDGVIVLPIAIDDTNTIKQFNVAGHGDPYDLGNGTGSWGNSSFHEFNDGVEAEWKEKGTHRGDFVHTHSYSVPTITLLDFVNIYNIDEVEYLWIDAQGHDFTVIKSLGDKLSIIKEGRCEATHNLQLYQVDNYYKDIVNYLTQRGFKCEVSLDNSGFGAECDIHFRRNDEINSA